MATLTYACPPPAFDPPPVEDCTEIDVLDFVAATNAGDLGLATAPFGYLQLVCVLVEDLDLQRGALAERISELAAQVTDLTAAAAQAAAHLSTVVDQLAVAQGIGFATGRQLEASRDAHQSTILDLETMTHEHDRAVLAKLAIDQHRNAALADVDQQRRVNIALSNENRQLRTVAAFDTTSRAVTGLSVSALNAQLNADHVALNVGVTATRQVMRHRNHAPTIPMASMFDVSDETHVVDMGNLDEPAVCRTITPRSRTKTMGEENGWDR